jgi:rare lipoprotein A
MRRHAVKANRHRPSAHYAKIRIVGSVAIGGIAVDKKYFAEASQRMIAHPLESPFHKRPRRLWQHPKAAFALLKHGALSRSSILLAALVSLTLLTACGSRRATARVPLASIGATEEGIASWYGEPYHGRRAANGEIFDMEQSTAAHPSLPFETWVRVQLLVSKKETEVRITDRGPFVKGRIIDLSRAAARDVGLLRAGTANVRITVIAPPKAYLRGRKFTVQVSSLPAKARAESLQRQLAGQYEDVSIRHRSANGKGGHAEAWRVLVGREDTPASAHRILERLLEKFPRAFVVPWDAE